jgi:hypothetical protein
LHQAKRLLPGELDQGVENGSGSEREANEGHGSNACVSLQYDIGEDEAGGV